MTPRAAVVVHGRDQDPEYMLEYLVTPVGVDAVAYRLPRHPERSWYAGRFFDDPERLEPALTDALDALDAEIAATGLPTEHIVLVGFSQGACLIAELLARRTRRFAGAAILTGSLFGPADGVRRPGPEVARMPMFFSGGREDEWVPLARVRATYEVFRAAGADAEFVEHLDAEHHIRDADHTAVRALLTATLEA